MSHISSFSNPECDSLYVSKVEEDLFACDSCDIEFTLESDKIKEKEIKCPVCGIILEAWQKRWNP